MLAAEAKTDEMLLPVIKAFEVTHTQGRIDSYFNFEHRFARFSSTRLAATVGAGGTGAAGAAAKAQSVAKRQRKQAAEKVDVEPAEAGAAEPEAVATGSGEGSSAGAFSRKRARPAPGKAAAAKSKGAKAADQTPTKPRRAPSGYDLFGVAERAALKAAGELPSEAKAVFGLLGERWRALDADAKAAWNAKAKAAATPAAAAAASSGASSAAVVAVPAPAATVARGKSAASSDNQQLFDAAAFAEDGEESDDCELPW